MLIATDIVVLDVTGLFLVGPAYRPVAHRSGGLALL
jgi:hypothetical protein